MGLAIATSVVVALGLGYSAMKRGGFPTNARDLIGGGGHVELALPAKDESAPLRVLTWHAVPGARDYIVEVRRDDGTVVLRSASNDTVFTVADSIATATTGVVYWGVSPTLADGTERRSATRRLRIPAR
jgi:hypothetical protein